MTERSLVVVAHPRPGGFLHALADAASDALAAAGHEVTRHDLYAHGFDPVLRAAESITTRADDADHSAFEAGSDELTVRYRRDLAAAHTLVVAHPNWWGKPPAMMAGWMDRVIAPGVAYRLDDATGTPTCLLRLRRLVVLNTGDTPPERERDDFGDPLGLVWERCVAAYLGEATVARLLATPLGGSTTAQRERWLHEARRLVHTSDRADRD